MCRFEIDVRSKVLLRDKKAFSIAYLSVLGDFGKKTIAKSNGSGSLDGPCFRILVCRLMRSSLIINVLGRYYYYIPRYHCQKSLPLALMFSPLRLHRYTHPPVLYNYRSEPVYRHQLPANDLLTSDQ